MPWLIQLNPRICWRNRRLFFDQDFRETGVNTETNISLAHVTSENCDDYQAFAEVFVQQTVETLLPHRELYCAINLIPGAQIPHVRVYALNPKETEVLRKYLEENLHKKFILPSVSTAGATLVFYTEKRL